jgi:hypothetical protein
MAFVFFEGTLEYFPIRVALLSLAVSQVLPEAPSIVRPWLCSVPVAYTFEIQIFVETTYIDVGVTTVVKVGKLGPTG